MTRKIPKATDTATVGRLAKRLPDSVLGGQVLVGDRLILDVLAGDFEVVSPGFDPVIPGAGIPRKCLDDVQVIEALSANRTTVKPFQSIELRWAVNIPSKECKGMPLRLTAGADSRYVAESGSLHVQPEGGGTNIYALIAYAGGKSRIISKVTVEVDTSDCFTIPVPGSVLQEMIEEIVDELEAEGDLSFSLRKDPQLKVTAEGIHVKLHISVQMPTLVPNAKVDFDFTVALNAVGGHILPLYTRFDWSLKGVWSIIPKAFIYGMIETLVKPKILDEFRRAIDDEVGKWLPDVEGILAVELVQDEVRLTVCPA